MPETFRVTLVYNSGDKLANIREDNAEIVAQRVITTDKDMSGFIEISTIMENILKEQGFHKQNHNHHFVRNEGEEVNVYIGQIDLNLMTTDELIKEAKEVIGAKYGKND